MNSMLCSRCKKRPAVLFLSRIEGNDTVNEGLCLKCARELEIPQVKDVMDKMGITDEDIDNMNNQMMEFFGPDGSFNPGEEKGIPFLQSMLSKSAESDESEPVLPAKQPSKPENGTDSSQGRKAPAREKFKFLDNYCENLTEKALTGKIDRIIGRDKEIYRVIQILNRRQKNNPCLIGEPGVGKTAIAEGIAQKLALGDVPPSLYNKELYLLDLTALVAGTQFRGQFESRVKGLVEDIKTAGNVILFIDEVHNLMGAGDSEGSMNAANILKPALSRGEIQVIGATTFNEYRKHIEKDAALERRFQPVKVYEPSIEETVEVLKGIKDYYEKFHRVELPNDIIERAVIMSERYITDRYLPDKAIDLIDEACSCCNLENTALVKLDKLKRKLTRLEREEEEFEQSGDTDYERLAGIRADTLRTSQDIKEIQTEALGQKVTLAHLAKVVELWTGIPADKIKESEYSKVRELESHIKEKIVGQDQAVELVAAAVRRSRIRLGARRRPASFIFVGPTGVGKTELVKVLSREMFDDADPLIRLDMSEFMEKHSVSRIVGSPPGYVGYDEAGQLTEKVRRKPYSVILFDEIEKAHPDVMNILLQILDEGKISDAHGRVVSFENTIIVMTSNAGSESKTPVVGFNKPPIEIEIQRAHKALSAFLRPEFLGRIDEIVVFRPLSSEDFEKIAALMLDEFKVSLAERGIKFGYDKQALEVIAAESFGQKSGARDIQKVIRKQVEDPITSCLIDSATNEPALMKITAADGKLRLITEHLSGPCPVNVSKNASI